MTTESSQKYQTSLSTNTKVEKSRRTLWFLVNPNFLFNQFSYLSEMYDLVSHLIANTLMNFPLITLNIYYNQYWLINDFFLNHGIVCFFVSWCVPLLQARTLLVFQRKSKTQNAETKESEAIRVLKKHSQRNRGTDTVFLSYSSRVCVLWSCMVPCDFPLQG